MSNAEFGKEFKAGKYTITEGAMSLSGDTFSIANEDGETVIESNAALFSLRDSFTAKCTDDDKDLFTMKKVVFSMHEAYSVQKGSGGPVIATIMKTILALRDTVCVYPGEDTNAEPLITCVRDLITDYNRTFYKGDEEIGSSYSEQCNFWANLCGTNKYDVEILDDEYAIIMLATMLACDEMKEDGGEDDQ